MTARKEGQGQVSEERMARKGQRVNDSEEKKEDRPVRKGWPMARTRW